MKRYIVFMCLLGLAIFLDSLFPTSVYEYAIAPLVLGALIAGGSMIAGSAISGVMNNRAIDKSNATNVGLQNETNRNNREMFNEQMEYNKYMYEDQKSYNNQLIQQMNDYNSPAAQRQRLEEAGYNPYLAYGNVDSGQMQNAFGVNAPSAPSAPVQSAPRVQPLNYDFIGNSIRDVGSVMDSYFKNSNIAADTITKSIDNITRLDENMARLQNLRANKDLTDTQKKHLDEQITNLQQMRDLQLEQMRQQNESLRADVGNKKLEQQQRRIDLNIAHLQKEYQAWFNEWSKKKGQKEIEQLQSIIMNLNANTALQTAQELTEKAKKFGVDLSNEQVRQLTPLLIRGQQLENKQKELENKYGSNLYSAGGRWFERINKYTQNNMEKTVGYRRTVRW